MGWDFSKKNEKNEILKKMKIFEREMKFTSIFFVSAGQKSEKNKNLKKYEKNTKTQKTPKKNVQIILMNTLWKKRLKSPPALRGRF